MSLFQTKLTQVQTSKISPTKCPLWSKAKHRLSQKKPLKWNIFWSNWRSGLVRRVDRWEGRRQDVDQSSKSWTFWLQAPRLTSEWLVNTCQQHSTAIVSQGTPSTTLVCLPVQASTVMTLCSCFGLATRTRCQHLYKVKALVRRSQSGDWLAMSAKIQQSALKISQAFRQYKLCWLNKSIWSVISNQIMPNLSCCCQIKQKVVAYLKPFSKASISWQAD